MSKTFSRVIIGAFLLGALGIAAQGQSNLTAKANPYQPGPAAAVVETDRIKDGLVGPVRRVRTEIAKLSSETGKLLEGKHAVLEVVSYDIKGNKTENQYFPIAGANLTGKEVYKYDEKGNISEMTLLNDDGSLLSKEVYRYEFDFAGNWNKMTTAVAVIEAGRMSFEPTEVTYRAIMYYLDENMLKMAQPASPPAASPLTNTVAVVPSETKSAPAVVKSPENNPSATRKSAVSLPAMMNAEKLSNLGSPDVANAKLSSSVKAPVIQIDSEPPPPPAPKPNLRPMSGGVLNGTALNLPMPTYPEVARRMKISGVVAVEVVVDETGKVISARANGGPMALRDASVQAAMKARFSPTKLSGQPIKVAGLINYRFATQ